jgi:hypothetical protein
VSRFLFSMSMAPYVARVEIDSLIIAASMPNICSALRRIPGSTISGHGQRPKDQVPDHQTSEKPSSFGGVNELTCACCGRYELASTTTAIHELACSCCGQYELASISRAELACNPNILHELASNPGNPAQELASTSQ